MSSSDFFEHPPLLPVGFHLVTLAGLRQLCVAPFPSSLTRPSIMDGFETVVRKLDEAGIAGEIWVNGSFLTDKADPNDLDASLRVPFDIWDLGTPGQKAIMKWVEREDLRGLFRCDLYVWTEYPTSHPDYALGQWMAAYWHRQWGFSRDDEMKGIAVLTLPLGDL